MKIGASGRVLFVHAPWLAFWEQQLVFDAPFIYANHKGDLMSLDSQDNEPPRSKLLKWLRSNFLGVVIAIAILVMLATGAQMLIIRHITANATYSDITARYSYRECWNCKERNPTEADICRKCNKRLDEEFLRQQSLHQATEE